MQLGLMSQLTLSVTQNSTKEMFNRIYTCIIRDQESVNKFYIHTFRFKEVDDIVYFVLFNFLFYFIIVCILYLL